MKKTVERYIYTGDKLLEDLSGLREELFNLCKKEEIRLEKRALRKYGRLTLISEIDVNQVLFNYDGTAFVLAFCSGVDPDTHGRIYEKYNFVKTGKQYDRIWNELYFKDASQAPSRVGIYIEVYANRHDEFLPEIKRSENALLFIYDDKGNKLINTDGKDQNEVIDKIDKLLSEN